MKFPHQPPKFVAGRFIQERYRALFRQGYGEHYAWGIKAAGGQSKALCDP